MGKRKIGIIASAIMVCVVCISLIAGSTLALFTANSSVDITVSSAKLDVTANIVNTEESPIICSSDTDSVLINGVNDALSAKLDGKNLVVTNLLPGDIVSFKVDINSTATVAIKYRVRFDCLDGDSLASNLILSVDGASYLSQVSAWEIGAATDGETEQTIATKEVSVAMPAFVKNVAQNLSCKIAFTVEAVQANAVVSDADATRAYRVHNQSELTEEFYGKIIDNDVIILDNADGSNWTIETDIAKSFVITGCDVGTLNVNAPNATIDYRINESANVVVQAVARDSMHIHGAVGTLTVNDGHVVVEQTAAITEELVVAPAVNMTANVEVKSASLPALTISEETKGEAVIAIAENVVVDKIVNNADESVKPEIKNDGTIKVTDEASLIQAIALGGEVVLSNDINVANAIRVYKSVAIRGNGYSIKSSATRGIMIDACDVTLVLDRVNIVHDGNAVMQRAVQVNPDMTGATVTIDGCILEATHYTVNICNNVSVDLTIRNSEITGWGTINLWSAGYVVVVEDTILRGINDKSYNAAGWNGFGTVVIEGDTTYKTEEHASEIDVTLTRCTIIAESKTGNIQKAVLFNSQSKGNNVVLTDCVIELENENCINFIDNGINNSLILINDGVRTVSVASVEALTKALNDCEQNIVLTRDIDGVSSTFTAVADVTLDLNGNVIICSEFDVLSKINVVIKNGAMSTVYAVYANREANVTLKDVTLVMTGKEDVYIGKLGATVVIESGVYGYNGSDYILGADLNDAGKDYITNYLIDLERNVLIALDKTEIQCESLEMVYSKEHSGVVLMRDGEIMKDTNGNVAYVNRFLLNCYDSAFNSGTARIIVKGGVFVNFNPACNVAEGANTNFVADGYSVVYQQEEAGDYIFVVVADADVESYVADGWTLDA